MPTKPKNNNKISGRDHFQTPAYATEILIPFIPKKVHTIWECASGKGYMTEVLRNWGYEVVATDVNHKFKPNRIDFLGERPKQIGLGTIDAIITNPPYSKKREFYEKCLEYEKPFALLIPADYCGWIIEALQYGCEKIIPTRRIDFITPTGKSGETGQTSYYHSMWLTKGFNLGRSETFFELTNKQKKENIYPW